MSTEGSALVRRVRRSRCTCLTLSISLAERPPKAAGWCGALRGGGAIEGVKKEDSGTIGERVDHFVSPQWRGLAVDVRG